MKKITFHLIANAHLDPVWLWDWREGMNEGLITCRTILNLMDEFDELTFVRGESAIYQFIEEHDPKTFRRILKYIEAGRWDVVGGTVIQPDTNLPAAETFARLFTHGQSYFKSRFGFTARVAWAADSFGHCAGLPEVMAQSGITGFAFTRPMEGTLPLAKPAFWWEGPGGSRVMGYRPTVGWYGTQRMEMQPRLDASLEEALKCDLKNVGIFYGLGDHGGGPSRVHVREIRRWAAAHPEVNVVHSGLHRLFDALHQEKAELPIHHGEMNFTLRGCYASVAKFKFAYRKTEALLASVERTDSVIRSSLNEKPADLREAWDSVLFNSFHDILPGSSIERAYDEQLAWLGGAFHQSQRVELSALNALALKVDTRVAKPEGDFPSALPVLVWNPHPWPFKGHMEWEACMDYRDIAQYKGRGDQLPLRVLDADGRALPFQVVANENALDNWGAPWRKRVVVPVELPPLGWKVFEYGWVEGAEKPQSSNPVCAGKPGMIDNGLYQVQAKVGGKGIKIGRKGKPVLGGEGLSAVVVEDQLGSWGAEGQPETINLSKVLEHWKIAAVETLESGPERAKLWVRLAGARSWIELSFQLFRGQDAVEVSARVLWNERYARLKLVMPVGATEAEFEVPGARVRRKPCGEVPGGRWVRTFGKAGTFGFASDSLYCFDCTDGMLRATVVRSSGYAHSGPPLMKDWRPAVDCGELKFRFLINPGNKELPFLAQTLEQPPVAVLVPAKQGPLPKTGSLASLSPASLQVLALKRAEDGKGLVLRVQETSGQKTVATWTWLGQTIQLGAVKANTLASWRLLKQGGRWKATRTSIVETGTGKP
ncbi:MAG: glycoside hydrolase family 38 C-terminal domain-containing protein [bacterium]